MSRFDRQGTEGGDLPALLGTATEEFRRSLERHVQQIVEAAKGNAAEIERDADRNAKQKEQQLDLRAQELVQGVITRASSVLDSIELVQSAISGMLAELRAEVKALEAGESDGSGAPSPSTRAQAVIGSSQDQSLAKEVPAQPTQPRVAAPGPAESPPAQARATRKDPTPPVQMQPRTGQAPPTAEATTEATPAKESRSAIKSQPATTSQPPAEPPPARVEQPRVAEPAGQRPPSQGPPAANEEKPGPLIERAPIEPKAQPDRNADSSAEFDQMIHGEIRRMFHSGKSREDVESFLGRFELGDNYLGLLDELYSHKDPSGRRRIFGRRRDR